MSLWITDCNLLQQMNEIGIYGVGGTFLGSEKCAESLRYMSVFLTIMEVEQCALPQSGIE